MDGSLALQRPGSTKFGFRAQKLGMDFAEYSDLCVSMDKATDDRNRKICSQIGTIMEDVSVVALVWHNDDGLNPADRLHKIRHAHTEIGRLLQETTDLLR